MEPLPKTLQSNLVEIPQGQSVGNIVPSANGTSVTEGAFSSQNYRPGQSGWSLNANGNIEANSAELRGSLTIDSGSDITMDEGGDINFTVVPAPTALTATLVATGTGNVTNGTHEYVVTYITSHGETSISTVSNSVNVDGSHKQVTLSSIPVSTSKAVSSRKIYRSKAGAPGAYFLLTTISDNTTTTYTDNIADGSLTGGDVSAKDNTAFGKIMVDGNTVMVTGSTNTFLGQNIANNLTTGGQNAIFGASCLTSATTAGGNTAIGFLNLKDTTTGLYNTAIGSRAARLNSTGSNNTAIGGFSLYNNLTGSNNVAIGHFAGAYETLGSAFYVDNQDRGSSSGDKAGALMYGNFNSTPSNQSLVVNASLTVAQHIIANKFVRLKGYTVATLPAGTQGDTCFVTDALAPTYLGALVGGGAVVTPVFYNGTAWIAH